MQPLALPSYAVSKAPTVSSVATSVLCPLCGLQFAKAEAACSGCVMLRGCGMLKCPNCSYEFTVDSKIVGWLGKIFGRIRGGIKNDHTNTRR